MLIEIIVNRSRYIVGQKIDASPELAEQLIADGLAKPVVSDLKKTKKIKLKNNLRERQINVKQRADSKL